MALQTQDRELITAQARHVRTSARKARLVLEHIRGLPAVEAEHVLAFQTRAVARDAGKVLHSAIANAENNFGHDADDLVVVLAYADEGPTLKRWRARARGRVNRIKKRTCHITIKLSPALPGEIKPRRERPQRPVKAEAAAVAAEPVEAAVEEPESVEPPEPEAIEQPEASEHESAGDEPGDSTQTDEETNS